MRQLTIAMLTAAILIIPGISLAQRHGNREGQRDLKSPLMKASMHMMQDNMGLMAEITDKMQQMMSSGRMSSEQRNQILNMMKKMSRMLREMAVPHDEEVKKRHNHELHKTLNELDSL